MTYQSKAPATETLLAEHPARSVKLYAELASNPLYATVRLIAPKLLNTKRFSFWLGWIIDEKRWVRGGDARAVPPEVLEWAEPLIAAAYPSVQEAAGLTVEEVEALRAEQKAKRTEQEKRRKSRS